MIDPRSARPHLEVRPRFRCLVCRVFVVGTDDGLCPRCGWRPPSGLALSTRPSPPWVVPPWLVALGVAAAVALGLAVGLGV